MKNKIIYTLLIVLVLGVGVSIGFGARTLMAQSSDMESHHDGSVGANSDMMVGMGEHMEEMMKLCIEHLKQHSETMTM